jgi:hypothetical protein
LKAIRRFLWLVAASLFGVHSQGAAAEIEILSKEDATRLFRLSRPQWLQEIRTAVAAGGVTETGGDPRIPGMSTTTPEGDLLTVRLDYSQGDRKPVFIQVVVGYRPPRAALLFPKGDLTEVIDAAKRQMAPEFQVIGSSERIEGGLGLFFTIIEAKR